jgi:hypothetical protein
MTKVEDLMYALLTFEVETENKHWLNKEKEIKYREI